MTRATTRFDNLPTEELVRLEADMREERKLLFALIRERLKVECPLDIGKAYRIKSGRFEGRKMLLLYIVPGGASHIGRSEIYPLAEGPLDKSPGKWNIKTQQTRLENLDPEPLDG